MAIWLSGERENLDGLEVPDSMVEVLLFKQAIALGWDCPRASVLLIFRELHSDTFTIQTVGRILRMPEQMHYSDVLLNYGYVFTNLSKDKIQIVQDDMSYLTTNLARRRGDYELIRLESNFINTRIVRNRLGSRFRLALNETAEQLWGVNRDLGAVSYFDYNRERLEARIIELDVNRIEIVIPENVRLTGGIEVKMVDETARFAKTEDEIIKLFRQFCRAHVGSYAPVDSTPILEMALLLFFEEYLGISEFDAPKIVLHHQNQPAFVELITLALERYTKILDELAKNAEKKLNPYAWEVPAERIYNELYEEIPKTTHALEPYFQLNRASRPEIEFANFLEKHADSFDWWYKNGDSGKEHFAVPYTDAHGTLRLFYLDFVIKLKAGGIALFDTKTAKSDPEAPSKHNALLDYMDKENASHPSRKLFGGIIIPSLTHAETWRFCRNRITATDDLTGWEFFNPAVVNS